MNRQIKHVSRSRVQTTPQIVPRNPTIETDGGRILSDGIVLNGHARQAAVKDARQKMQMRYDGEAKEAAERKKQREQKKREAWLTRQEALVRPGHILGRGRIAEQNLIRDYVEHQDEDEYQQELKKTKQSWMHQEYNDLVRQGIEREREAAQLQRRENKIRDALDLSGQEAVVKPGGDSGYGGSAALGSSSRQGLPNRTSDYFLGTGYAATPPRSDISGFANQGNIASPSHVLGTVNATTPSSSNSHGFANQGNIASPGHVLGTANATTPSSSNSHVGTVQPDHREQMLAARRRLQEKYDAQIQQAAEDKEQEESDIAESFAKSSLN